MLLMLVSLLHALKNVLVPDRFSAVTYLANVGVGTPPTQYQLLIDTGSSNTGTNAQGNFVVTSTAQNTGEEVEVTYGSGSFFSGELGERNVMSVMQ